MEIFSKSAQKLSKNPLGIIALFLVLVYGIAGFVLGLSGESLEASHKSLLVWFLIIFPIIVFVSFIWLVVYHREKLYAPMDFRSDEAFFRMTPNEQKEKLEKDFIESTSQETTESIASQTTKKSKNAIKQEILLAEDLAFRELDTIYGISIPRNVNTSDEKKIAFDGLFVSDLKSYVVEVRYVRNEINMSNISLKIKSLSLFLAALRWKRCDLIFCLVLDNDELVSNISIEEISSKLVTIGTSFNVSVIPKVYLLPQLKEKYGIVEESL